MEKFRSFKAKRQTTTEDEWDCPKCTFKNSAKSFKCSICFTTRGTSTRKGTVNSQVAQQRELEEIIARHRQAQQRAKTKHVREFSINPSSPSARASTSRVSRSPDRISMESSSILTSSSIPSTSSYRFDLMPRRFTSPTPSTSRVSDTPSSETPSDFMLPSSSAIKRPRGRPLKRVFSTPSVIEEPESDQPPKKQRKKRPKVPNGFPESSMENGNGRARGTVFKIRYAGVVVEFEETMMSDEGEAE